MRYFNPHFTVNVPVHAIVKQTQNAICVKYKENTSSKDHVWFPRGWLYNIKYSKVKAKNGTVSKKITLVFYGFWKLKSSLKCSICW